jgi:RHS repeat-associated protein
MCPHKWNSGFKVLKQETSGGTLAETYVVQNPNAEVSTLLGMVSGSDPSTGTYAYFAHDHLGSVRAVYDADKAATGNYDYTPYGSIYAQAGATALTDLAAAFTGKPLDPASGLYSFPYRMYGPDLARWLSRDPLGMVDGPNVYGYVRGQALTVKDAFGGTGEYPLPYGSYPPVVTYPEKKSMVDLCQEGVDAAEKMYTTFRAGAISYIGQVRSWLCVISTVASAITRTKITSAVSAVAVAIIENPHTRYTLAYVYCSEGTHNYMDGYLYYLKLVKYTDLAAAMSHLISAVNLGLTLTAPEL